MKQTVFVAAIALGWMSHTARAGEPAWCKGEDFQEAASNFGSIAQQDTEDPRSLLEEIVTYSCSKSDPDLESKRGALDKLRADWSKNFAMSEADWSDALAYAKEKGPQSDTITRVATTLATLSPIDQYTLTSKIDDASPDYAADMLDANLTETGRLGYLEWCADQHLDVTREDSGMSTWALCQGDADKLDAAKFATELRGDTSHSGVEKMRVRIRFYVTREKLKKNAALAQKLFKKDEAYKKLYDAAAKGRADWATTVGGNKELLDLVQAMDWAAMFHSRKQAEGCEEKTAAALAAAVSTLPAKTFATMHDDRMNPFEGFAAKAGPVLVNVPIVNLAATAYVLCYGKQSPTAQFLAAYLHDVPGVRGPRGAAFTQLLQQKFELDDTSLKQPQLPQLGRRPYGSGGRPSSSGGVVKSVGSKAEKEGSVKVDLMKTTRKQEDCVKEHTTNRIVSIRNSGSVEYEIICDKTQIVEHDSTWLDFSVRAASSKLLKPGVLFSATYGDGGESDVIAVWPSKDAKLPSMVLGGKLK